MDVFVGEVDRGASGANSFGAIALRTGSPSAGGYGSGHHRNRQEKNRYGDADGDRWVFASQRRQVLPPRWEILSLPALRHDTRPSYRAGRGLISMDPSPGR